ncbi:glycosyltransferase, partial [bacterium]|nr:glycosyltransferase [bacterium]
MKLIYIANVRLPSTKAHGTQIMKMCESFVNLDQNLKLIIPQRIKKYNSSILDYYGIKNNFKIIKLFSLDLIELGFLNKYSVVLQEISFGISVFFHVLIHPKKYQSDCVFYLRDKFSACFLALIGKKVFLEFHAFEKKFKYFKVFFLKLTGLILLTRKAKENFIDLGVKKDQIFIEPDAVDLDIFDLNLTKKEARKKLELPQDKKILIYTGKFTTMGMDKGIDDTLKALKLLSEDIIFIAIGGSEADIKHYQEKVNKLKIENRVKFIGHVTQIDLARHQKAADILLMPFPYTKHYAYYMSPLKMFEYMASQRPIIATKLPATE